MRTFGIAAAIAGTAALFGSTQTWSAAENQDGRRDVYVNFQLGDDLRDGKGPATAWKHAPGDPAATGRAAAFVPVAGTHVRFAGGVTYRGAIEVAYSGTVGNPITYEGDGKGAAVISGADPVSFTRCRDAAHCGGAANWSSLARIDLPASVGEPALFADGAIMRPAQSPDPADSFYREEITDMSPIDYARLSAGEVPGAAGPGSKVALWVQGNAIVMRPVLSSNSQTIRFDPTGLQFYTDRPGRFAILNDIAAIDRPGEYAVLPDGGAAVAMLPPGTRGVEAARGRGGFRFRGASSIAIRGLTFEHMANGDELFGGVAILSDRPATDITIEHNAFRRFVSTGGQGPIIIRGANAVRIRDNDIAEVVLGSGMRLGGPGRDIVIEGNRIRRVGRTAIMVLGVDDVQVRRNIISDVRGVHGNGFSAYLDNSNVVFSANTVIDAKQPATFRGAAAKQTRPNALVFANNLLVATPGALGSLISWGGNARDVVIRGNVLIGGRVGLRLNGGDEGLVIENNVGVPPVVGGKPPIGWITQRNVWTKSSTLAAVQQFTPEKAGPAPSSWCATIMQGTGGTERSQDDRMIGATLTC